MAEISKQALKVANNTDFPDNNAGAITPSILRSYNTDVIDSTVNQTGYTADSASWNISVGALNAFTASQQPTFNSLNAFTASQLTINSGYNAYTQSTTADIADVVAEVDTLQAWTSSVNQISDDGIVQGYSTRLHFYGLVSASIVPNVNGPIASINIEQDGTKLNSASFNSYTASNNSRVDNIEAYTASLKTAITVNGTSASIAGDLNVVGTINAYEIITTIESSSVIFSSGSNILGDDALDTQTLHGIVNLPDGDLNVTNNIVVDGNVDGVDISSFYSNVNATTASINNSISLLSQSTGSSNAYTASNDQKWSDLQPISGTLLLTASFANNTLAFTKLNGAPMNIPGLASTGSNTFTANQTINGNLIANKVSVFNFDSLFYGSQMGGTTANGTFFGYGSTSYEFVVGAYAAFDNELKITANSSGVSFGDFNGSGYPTFLKLNPNSGTNPAPIFPRGVEVTGSVVGNVVPLTINSSTASMNLTQGNFFSLTLASGAPTQLTASNVKPGQTVNLLLTQPATPGTLTFSPSFKFSGGTPVSASAVANAKDIITFVTFDNSSVYTAIIKNLS